MAPATNAFDWAYSTGPIRLASEQRSRALFALVESWLKPPFHVMSVTFSSHCRLPGALRITT